LNIVQKTFCPLLIPLLLTVIAWGQVAPDVNEVLIGYFGPDDPGHPQGGDMWVAATLAIEDSNKKGGYRGKDFRLTPAWSDNPWGSGPSEVVRLAYIHKVWGIIGGIDGPSTHLAEQVVAKAHLSLINAASSDKSVNFANVPWVFSCLPADDIQAEEVAKAIAASGDSFVLISATDHDSHLFTVELEKRFIKYAVSPSAHYDIDPKTDSTLQLIDKIVKTNPPALVLIAEVDGSLALINAIEKKGFSGTVFGGPSIGRRRFLDNITVKELKLIFPLLYSSSESSLAFEREFQKRTGKKPDYLAAHTYDAVDILIASIRKAGLDRVRIRDEIKNNAPTKGIAGTYDWNTYGENVRGVSLGCLKGGRIKVFSDY
jgi:branched-chain amino acid transport system substrate-binding protein